MIDATVLLCTCVLYFSHGSKLPVLYVGAGNGVHQCGCFGVVGSIPCQVAYTLPLVLSLEPTSKTSFVPDCTFLRCLRLLGAASTRAFITPS